MAVQVWFSLHNLPFLYNTKSLGLVCRSQQLPLRVGTWGSWTRKLKISCLEGWEHSQVNKFWFPAHSLILQTQKSPYLKSNFSFSCSGLLFVSIRAEPSKSNVILLISKSLEWRWDGDEVKGEGVGSVSLWPISTTTRSDTAKGIASFLLRLICFALFLSQIKKCVLISHRQSANLSLPLAELASSVWPTRAESAAICLETKESTSITIFFISIFSLQATQGNLYSF